MKRMSFKDLYISDDSLVGGDIYYFDEALTMPFTGVVVDYYKGKLSWECEIKDGFRHGKERIYYDGTGELQEENDVENNTICGIQKEFYKSGKIKSKSIVLHNMHIDIISYDEDGSITKRYSINKENPPIGYHLDWDKIAEFRKRYSLE